MKVHDVRSSGRGLRSAVRTAFRRLPLSIQASVRRGVRRLPYAVRRVVGGTDPTYSAGTVRWGNLRRTSPLSRAWGYDRGTPIDRIYIEQFLSAHATDVRGACLEVLNADYTHRFGGAVVTGSDVLDINPSNTAATIIADLGEPDSLPAQQFDCVIFTQTLHLIPDMQIAIANVWRALSPGGVMLLTVPALGRHDARESFDHDRWRVTKTGLEWLLGRLPNARVHVATYGNVLSCVAFLYGLASEELRLEELQFHDREFPLIIGARVLKERAR